MAYLSPHFEYDVFVSYSHGDPDETGGSPLKEWSHDLIKALIADTKALQPEFRSLRVWWDKELDPTLQLTPELRRKVEAAALLMIVMSPNYLDSNWCRDEEGWFRSQVESRGEENGRVFVIRAVSTDKTYWPEFLRDDRGYPLIGFCFHLEPEHIDDVVQPQGWRGTIKGNEFFIRELAKLRTTLTRRLRELKARSSSARLKPTSRPPTIGRQPRIYLHARPEHAKHCATIDHVLRVQNNCILVAPPLPAPGSDLARWTEESRNRIAAARFCDALALVRPTADPAFVGDLLDLGVDELRRINVERGAPLPCAVLDAADGPLEIDPRVFGIERFAIGDPEWPTAFLSWLDKHRNESPSTLP